MFNFDAFDFDWDTEKNTFYVETRSLSDESDRIITKTQAETARDAVTKIKRQHAASGADNRDFTYTINPHSHW
jgi:hypothetical protein